MGWFQFGGLMRGIYLEKNSSSLKVINPTQLMLVYLPVVL